MAGNDVRDRALPCAAELKSALPCTAAMLLFLLSSSILNGTVFPDLNEYFAFAPDVAVGAGAVFLLVIALLAVYKPALMPTKAMLGALIVLHIAGFAITGVGVSHGLPVLMMLGACLGSAGRSLNAIVLGLAMVPHRARTLGIMLSIAFVLCGPLGVLCCKNETVAVLLFLAFPLLALALTWRPALPALENARNYSAPAELAITNPRSFLPLASPFFACILLYKIAFGYSLRFAEGCGTTLSEHLVMVLLALVLVVILLSSKKSAVDLLAQLSVLVVVAGFLITNSELGFASWAGAGVLEAGSYTFDLVSWAVLAALAKRNQFGAVSVIGWGRALASIGTLVGAAAGALVFQAANRDVSLFISGVLVMLFVGYALIGLKNFSFAETIAEVVPSAHVEAPVSEESVPQEDVLAKLSEQYKLSAREAEVFALLAQGRNAAFIQEKLVISRNTVKAHIKHIYTKLDIHDHQALIDLVEQAKELGGKQQG